MRICKPQILLLLLLGIAISAYAGIDVHKTKSIKMQIQEVNALSTIQDTLQMTQVFKGRQSHNSMYGIFILSSTNEDSAMGLGLTDSSYLWLYSSFRSGDNKEYYLLAADTCNDLPCTLRVSFLSNDTLLKEALWIGYRITDTLSDTTFAASYLLNYDINLYEK